MEAKRRLGLAMCGSYCTYAQVFAACEALREQYELVPILSETAAETDTRFGTAAEHIRRLRELTGRTVRTTIPEAEPIPGFWGVEKLYRITLTTKEKFVENTFVLTIE